MLLAGLEIGEIDLRLWYLSDPELMGGFRITNAVLESARIKVGARSSPVTRGDDHADKFMGGH